MLNSSCPLAAPNMCSCSAMQAMQAQIDALTARLASLERIAMTYPHSPPPSQPPSMPPPPAPPTLPPVPPTPPPPCGSDSGNPCPSCKALYDKTGSLGAGQYTVRPAAESITVWCTSEGWTKVVRATTISDYQGSGASGSISSGRFKLSDTSITEILQAHAGTGMRFQCGSYTWTVPDWLASGLDDCSAVEDGCSASSPGAWQMQYPPRGTGWYQGYSIPGQYGDNTGSALETRLSNAYGTSYSACRVHEVGDYDLTIWVT